MPWTEQRFDPSQGCKTNTGVKARKKISSEDIRLTYSVKTTILKDI